jgi:hypothetical protein
MFSKLFGLRPKKTSSVVHNIIFNEADAENRGIEDFDVSDAFLSQKHTGINGNSFIPFNWQRSTYQSQIDVIDKLNIMNETPTYISYAQLENMYTRNPIAKRVCDTFPDYCWNPRPVVLEIDNTSGVPETKFEKQCAEIADKVNLFEYFRRADIAAQKGQYGVLYIAFNDKNAVDQDTGKINTNAMQNAKWHEGFKNPSTGDDIVNEPQYLGGLGEVDWESIKGMGADAIKMVVPYEQPNAWPTQFAVNYSAPGFSLISYYNLQSGGSVFGTNGQANIVYGASLPVTWNVVHSSRCVHIVDNNVGNNILGVPALYPIFNDLLNMIRVTGGSSMSFQLNARGGLAISIDTELGQSPTPDEMKGIKSTVKKYLSNFSRVLFAQNMKVTPINFETPSPDKHYLTYLQNISAGTSIPGKILVGNESGKRASDQDKKNFDSKVKLRQVGKCTTWVKQFFDPLIAHGVIEPPESGTYKVHFPTLDIPDDETQAANYNQVAQGLSALAASPSSDVEERMPEFIDKANEILKVKGETIKLKATKDSYLSPDTRVDDMQEVFKNEQIRPF